MGGLLAVLSKVPWKTVGKVASTAATMGFAAWGALQDQKQKEDFATMKTKYEKLSKLLEEKQN